MQTNKNLFGTARNNSGEPNPIFNLFPFLQYVTAFQVFFVHMMVMFYLCFFGYAIYSEPQAQPPQLIPFAVIWHVTALLTWPFVRFSKFIFISPFRVALTFGLILCLIWLGKTEVKNGFENMYFWVQHFLDTAA